jgi:iron-sulfur cluster assembly accessory protein
MITLTQTAASALQSAISGSSDPVGGLRILVEEGGCAGFKYVMGLVTDGESDDLVCEDRGIKVFVDPASAPRIQGTTIDFVVGMEGSGFSFNNPQARSSCSCGKSFG